MRAQNLVSQRVKLIQPSASIKAAERVKELKNQGIKIFNLTIGEPDFNTPEIIKKAAYDALQKNLTHYTHSMGIIELRQAISEKLSRDNKVNYDPDKEILVTPGGKQAIFYAITALIEKNDEVILIEPYWLSYRDIVKLAGGKIIALKTNEKDYFKPRISDLEKKISKRTKVIIINSPNNPTGMVLDKKDLQAIARIAKKHNIIIISDEIYEKIIFDAHKHYSIASLPNMKNRTITIGGFSKTYAMTGWRLGYLAASRDLMQFIIKTHQHTATCVSGFAQSAGVVALKKVNREVKTMVKEYQKRRDLVYKGINSLKHFSCLNPAGTFYLFVNIKKMKMDSQSAAEFLLNKAGIATIAGDEYGLSGEGYLRLALTIPKDELTQMIGKLRKIDKIFSKA